MRRFLVFAFVFCLLQKNVLAQSNTWPDFRGNMIGVPAPSSGAMPSGIIFCPALTDDSPTQSCHFQGMDAWAEAIVNPFGGNTVVCAGIGTRLISIDNFALCAGDSVTFTLNEGALPALVEGVDWAAGASNNDAAISLAIAVAAQAGISDAYVVGAGTDIFIVPELRTCEVGLAESDATCTTLTEDPNGSVFILSNIRLLGIADIITDADGNTRIETGIDDQIDFYPGGNRRLSVASFGVDIPDASAFFIGSSLDYGFKYDSAGTELRFTSTDCDGGGTDCNWLTLQDGTDDPIISGNLTASRGIFPSAASITGAGTDGVSVNFYTASQLRFGSTLTVGWSTLIVTDAMDIGLNRIAASLVGLTNGTNTNAAIVPGKNIAAAPTEPFTCDATHEGAMQYIDDTNDTNFGRVCICANQDGTGYDWRDIGDIVGTACPFF